MKYFILLLHKVNIWTVLIYSFLFYAIFSEVLECNVFVKYLQPKPKKKISKIEVNLLTLDKVGYVLKISL